MTDRAVSSELRHTLTVLAVDDRVENLAALQAALRGMDLQLLEAGSGREALGVLLRERPAVVIMDVNMPEMDGFETARLIRANPATATLPIIFLTASDPDASTTYTGYAAGAVDYMHKPINREILRSKVQIFLDLRRQQRELERALAELEDVNRNLEQRAHDRALALRESERRFTVAMEQSPVGMAIVSIEREWLAVNESLCQTVGYRRHELVGTGVDEIVHGDDLGTAREWMSRVLAGEIRGYEHEQRFIHKSGVPIWVREGGSIVRSEEGEPSYFVMRFPDVTEARLVRRAAECVASDLIGLEGAALIEGVALHIAEVFQADVGFVAEPVPGTEDTARTLAMIVGGEVVEPITYRLSGTPSADTLSGGMCIVLHDVQRRYPDDEHLRVLGAEAYGAKSFSDPEGALLGYAGVIARRPFSVATEGIERVLSVFTNALTSALVKERERDRFRQLFELAPDALIQVDEEGLVRLVNRHAERVFGWPREDLIGQPIEVLVPAALRKGHARLRAEFTAEGGQRAMGMNIPNLRGVRRDGTEFPTEISLGAMESASGRAIVASVRDLTERAQLESQLRQAQKMESVGRLAAGVAHDFNNMLSVVLTTAELAATVATQESVREDLHVIRDAAEGAANLTGQLLALSRRHTIRAELTDMSEVVRKAEPLARRALGELVSLVLRLRDDLPPVVVDPRLFQQVIMNLVINARDAIEDSGVVTIETGIVTLDETYERTHEAVRSGPHVLLAISDTGSGMDAETQERIFEPFFTTKASGKGTGLGMSTAYGIVKQANGDVRVYSEPGVGTTFKVYLPVSHHDLHPQEEVQPDAGVEPLRRDEAAGERRPRHVLVVDDDPQVLRAVTRILERAGYDVSAAEGPEEALQLVDSGVVESVDLLVSDVVMPQINGQELADRIRERFPEAKVLFSSGYTGETINQNGLLTAGFEFISKPYSVEEFTRKVGEMLSA